MELIMISIYSSFLKFGAPSLMPKKRSYEAFSFLNFGLRIRSSVHTKREAFSTMDLICSTIRVIVYISERLVAAERFVNRGDGHTQPTKDSIDCGFPSAAPKWIKKPMGASATYCHSSALCLSICTCESCMFIASIHSRASTISTITSSTTTVTSFSSREKTQTQAWTTPRS